MHAEVHLKEVHLKEVHLKEGHRRTRHGGLGGGGLFRQIGQSRARSQDVGQKANAPVKCCRPYAYEEG
jgi:hypothetical protein